MMSGSEAGPCAQVPCGWPGTRQKLSSVLPMVAFAVLAVSLASLPSVVCAQAIEAPISNCYASLSKAKLVALDAGWAIVDQPMHDIPEPLWPRGLRQ
jgi:hypothetical protein